MVPDLTFLLPYLMVNEVISVKPGVVYKGKSFSRCLATVSTLHWPMSHIQIMTGVYPNATLPLIT